MTPGGVRRGDLLVGVLLMTRSMRRGRELCRLFTERLPEEYAERGSPLPDCLASPRRHEYFRLLMQRGFAQLGDPRLVSEFSESRRIEMRQLVVLLAGLSGPAIAFAWLRWFGAA